MYPYSCVFFILFPCNQFIVSFYLVCPPSSFVACFFTTTSPSFTISPLLLSIPFKAKIRTHLIALLPPLIRQMYITIQRTQLQLVQLPNVIYKNSNYFLTARKFYCVYLIWSPSTPQNATYICKVLNNHPFIR